MVVFTFGSTEKTINNCEIVRATLKTLDGEIEMTLLTSPIICEPLTEQPLALCVNLYEHLSDLHLARRTKCVTMDPTLRVSMQF